MRKSVFRLIFLWLSCLNALVVAMASDTTKDSAIVGDVTAIKNGYMVMHDLLMIRMRELPAASAERRILEHRMHELVTQEHQAAIANAEAREAAALAQVQFAEKTGLAGLGYKEPAGMCYGMPLDYRQRREYTKLLEAYRTAQMHTELTRKSLADWTAE